MTEARIGRLLAPCLHQAIGDLLPLRLEFYEFWLRSEGMRDGTIGIAPMSAVLGFLRTESEYHEIVARAGQLAAQWTIESMTPVRRRAIRWLPSGLRARVVLRVAAGIVRHVCSSSRTSTGVRRGHATVEVQRSLFCSVRETQKAPMCRFYAATIAAAFEIFGLSARATIEQCLAVDGSLCVVVVDATGGAAGEHRNE
jgi:bacteriochlorophyll 4-vinyl reductase